MGQKLFYYDNVNEWEEDRKKAIELLKEVGFNGEVLQSQIKRSNRDFGDEFFYTVVRSPEDLKEWAEKYDMSDKNNARDFVLYCLECE